MVGGSPPARAAGIQEDLRRIIFEADTPAGKAFDIGLLIVILLSVGAVLIESTMPKQTPYASVVNGIEWVITILFTLEYGIRIYCVQQPWRYIRSFFGLVDLLSILPAYVGLLMPEAESLLVIRALRLLRVFRVLKLVRYLSEANVLTLSLRASLPKVTIFLGTVMIMVIITGTAMYLIEGAENGFTSIPRSIYWAIVTMTTVGYGDIAPKTVLGQTLAAVVMILGYSIIAVPTGIVSAALVHQTPRPVTTRGCPQCLSEGHEPNARYCKDCGASLVRQNQE